MSLACVGTSGSAEVAALVSLFPLQANKMADVIENYSKFYSKFEIRAVVRFL
jgi:hypothetical protein